MNFSTPWFKNSWLKSLGLKSLGLKSPTSWDVLQPLVPLALVLLLSSRHQKVIKWQLWLFKMIKFSLKQHHFLLNFHFEWKKVSFEDFLVTTWERENESQRKLYKLLLTSKIIWAHCAEARFISDALGLFWRQWLALANETQQFILAHSCFKIAWRLKIPPFGHKSDSH